MEHVRNVDSQAPTPYWSRICILTRFPHDLRASEVKAMVLPVVMYGRESWTIKKAEHRRIDAFELWCWRRLLRVPWTARRSNQSTLKEINPHWKDWCWSSNTLAIRCKEPTHWKTPWCWERLKAGGKGDDRGWYGWMASLTQWTLAWASSWRWWRTGQTGVLQSMGSQSRTWLSDWTTAITGGAWGKESPANAGDKRYGFSPWVGKIPWWREWQTTPKFLPGESPGTEEPGRPQSMGSWRVRHDWSDLECTQHMFCLYTKIWEAVTYLIPKWRYRGQFSLCFFFFSQWPRKCCSEKEKRRGVRLFFSPFLITKKIKRTVSRPEPS